MVSTLNQQMLDFIARCPSPFHTVDTVCAALRQSGYVPLSATQDWTLSPGGKYYLTCNDSSLIAFRVPRCAPTGFVLTAAHSDSPTFKVKKEATRTAAGQYVQLCTEPYGGALLATWFDRPLGIAGRVLTEEGGRVVSHHIAPDEDVALIPSVAIHLDRTANDGRKINPAVETLPLWSMTGSSSFTAQLARWAGVSEDAVLDYDLYLVCRDRGSIWGAENAFVSAPRLDDLACVFGCLEGFLHAEENSAVNVLCVFDNEETGSATKQGAGSTLLRDTLWRIAAALGCSEAQYQQWLARSYMVSADNGHARHPNHPELSDEQNTPYLNGGLVIKYNAAQRYTTDGVSGALLRSLCRQVNVPVQTYANRSDMSGGSTLGSIATTTVPVRTVDIGLAQLAMHSCYETMGSADLAAFVTAMTALYSKAPAEENGALYWA